MQNSRVYLEAVQPAAAVLGEQAPVLGVPVGHYVLGLPSGSGYAGLPQAGFGLAAQLAAVGAAMPVIASASGFGGGGGVV